MEEREQRESKILHHAARVFKEKGYHGASVQDIADAVGIQKGSLYYHIESKEDLLFRVSDYGITMVVACLENVVQRDLPAVDKLRLSIRDYVQLLANNLDVLTVVLQDHKALMSARRESYLSLRKRFEALLRQIVSEGIAAGDFRDVDVPLATLAILGICNWLVIWYRPDGRLSPDEIADFFADLAVRSLLAGNSNA